jgi:hypothetical protein
LIDSRTRDREQAPQRAPSPEAVEFVRYCYRRRRLGWPELYDEMCAVASRGLYHGMGPDELSAEGIGFSLFEMQTLAALASRVIAEERERRDSALTPSIVRATPIGDRSADPGAGRPEPSTGPTRIGRIGDERNQADDEPRASARLRLAGAPAGA